MKMKIYAQSEKQHSTERVIVLLFTFALIYFVAYSLGRTGNLGEDPFFPIVAMIAGLTIGMMLQDGLLEELGEATDDQLKEIISTIDGE